MMKLTVNKKFKAVVPPLLPEEYAQLEQNILKDGIRDKIIVWKRGTENIIIDGHNRYEICCEHNIKFEIEEMEFENHQEVIDYIIKNQLGRRNITVKQRSYLIGKRFENEKKLPYRPIKNKKGGKNEPLKTAKKIADEMKISQSTVKNDEKFSESIDLIEEYLGTETKNSVLNGNIEVTKKDITKIRRLEPEVQQEIFGLAKVSGEKNLKHAIKEACDRKSTNELSEKVKKAPPKIYKMGYKEWVSTLQDNSVDLLITQPPNKNRITTSRAFIKDWVPIVFSKLKDTGSAYIFTSQEPREIRIYLNVFLNSNFNFRLVSILAWTFKNTSEQIPKIARELNWQPIFYLVGEKSNLKGSPIVYSKLKVPHTDVPGITDIPGVSYNRSLSSNHLFQKPAYLIKQLILFSSKKGETIIDPFASAGKFLITGVELDRKASGCEENDVILKVAENSGCKIIT